MKELEKIVENSLLFDFYGALLKENHRKIVEDYVLNDLSLSEIAQERGISRQGVHDIVKRSTIKLSEYEKQLNLIDKFNKTKQNIAMIHESVCEMRKTGNMNQLERIEKLTREILDRI